MKNSLINLMDDINTRDTEKAWSVATEFFASYGFQITNYGMIAKDVGNIVGFFSNMSDNWMQHYMDSEYDVHDPYGKYVATHSDALIYSQDGHSQLAVKDKSPGQKMLDEASEVGLVNSLCIPIHNSYGDMITGFNLATDFKNAEFTRILDEHLNEILLGAAFVNNTMVDVPILDCELPFWHASSRLERLLTMREIEVLKYLSEGNRNDRIAEKMRIAPVTVNYHMKEIKLKLGAKTREQAVAIAYKMRILH